MINEKLREVTINGVPLFDEDYAFGQQEDTTYGSDELDESGELPIGWVGRHYSELKDMEENVVDHVKAAQDASRPVDERIEEYETAIYLYDRMKQRFIASGECFAKYFADTWEHLHNSRCDDFVYIDPVKDELAQLNENYETIKKHDSLVTTLDADLIDHIKSRGKVLQADIYRNFDPVLKTDIQNKLYAWAKEGRILRLKSGRSYLISIQEQE